MFVVYDFFPVLQAKKVKMMMIDKKNYISCGSF